MKKMIPWLLGPLLIFLTAGYSVKSGAPISGAASTIAYSNLTANRALISNSSGKVAVSSSVSDTELSYLDGVTSAIQSQFSSKQDTLSLSANAILARPSASPGTPSSLTLSANQFPCRGSTGDLSACSVGTGLSFSGTTLNSTAGSWVQQTQASNGNTLTLSGLSGDLYEFEIYVTSASASSVMDIALNSSSGSYTYYQQYNGAAANGSAGPGYFAAGAVGSGSVTAITGRAFANGSIVGAHIFSAATGLGMAQSLIYKTLAASNITAITINSNQANGIGAGSYIRALKIS